MMDSITRKLDELGGIFIPKQFLEELGIKKDETLVLTVENGTLKMWKKSESKADIAAQYWAEHQHEIKQSLARFDISGPHTTCEVIKRNTRRTGTAFCYSDDTMEPLIGMVIAFCRAYDYKVPQALLKD